MVSLLMVFRMCAMQTHLKRGYNLNRFIGQGHSWKWYCRDKNWREQWAQSCWHSCLRLTFTRVEGNSGYPLLPICEVQLHCSLKKNIPKCMPGITFLVHCLLCLSKKNHSAYRNSDLGIKHVSFLSTVFVLSFFMLTLWCQMTPICAVPHR